MAATSNSSVHPNLYRLLDANLNRLKEGIRVNEDCARYLFNDKKIALSLKNLRHQATINEYEELLKTRDSINDVLKVSIETELQRSNLRSIIIANFKRSQESARVLEESLKLINIAKSEEFKTIRYTLYALEKDYMELLNEESLT